MKHELVPTRNDELNDTTREAFFFIKTREALDVKSTVEAKSMKRYDGRRLALSKHRRVSDETE